MKDPWIANSQSISPRVLLNSLILTVVFEIDTHGHTPGPMGTQSKHTFTPQQSDKMHKHTAASAPSPTGIHTFGSTDTNTNKPSTGTTTPL